jgi:hypothetical protein
MCRLFLVLLHFYRVCLNEQNLEIK